MFLLVVTGLNYVLTFINLAEVSLEGWEDRTVHIERVL